MNDRFAEELAAEGKMQPSGDVSHFGDIGRIKLSWTSMCRVGESLNLVLTQKGDSFQLLAKDCLPVLEVLTQTLRRFEARVEKGPRGESQCCLLQGASRTPEGALLLSEVVAAEEGKLSVADAASIQRVGVAIASREGKTSASTQAISNYFREFRSQLIVPKASGQHVKNSKGVISFSLIDLAYFYSFRLLLVGDKDSLLEELDVYCSLPECSYTISPVGQSFKFVSTPLSR